MSLLLLSLLAVAEPAEASPPVVRKTVVARKLEIPDEIAPAVVPYLSCLFAKNGVELRGQSDLEPSKVEKGGDCAAVREEAARNADTLLRRSDGRSSSERSEFIERTLLSLDELASSAAKWTTPEGSSNAAN